MWEKGSEKVTIKDQVVIITGAANGIGATIAYQYAKQGATVVIADRDKEAGNQILHTIHLINRSAIFIETDIRNPDQIMDLMKNTVARFGKIDSLINNAGVSRFQSVYDLTVEEWDEIIAINLRGTFLCAREAAKQMKHNEQGGAIINIASTRALMSEKNSEAYAASKGGIVALTHALAASLSDDNIRVNCISPGWIETGDYNLLRTIDHQQHFSKRVGKPEDIARACLFLTDPANDFINSENIIIDGGMTRKMIYEH